MAAATTAPAISSISVILGNTKMKAYLSTWYNCGTKTTRLYDPDSSKVQVVNFNVGKSKQLGAFSFSTLAETIGEVACLVPVYFMKLLPSIHFYPDKMNSYIPKFSLLSPAGRQGGEIEGLRSGLYQAGLFVKLNDEEGEIEDFLVTRDHIEEFIATRSSNWMAVALFDEWKNDERHVSCDFYEMVEIQNRRAINIGPGDCRKLTSYHQSLLLMRHIVIEVIKQLAGLSTKGIMHRDIKAENILLIFDREKLPKTGALTAKQVARALRIRVIDGGNMKRHESKEEPTRIRDRRGSINIGSVAYCPPEILDVLAAAEDEKAYDITYAEYDETVDTFGMGVALFLALTRIPPFAYDLEDSVSCYESYESYWRDSKEALGFLDTYFRTTKRVSEEYIPSRLCRALCSTEEEFEELRVFFNRTLAYDKDSRSTSAELAESYASWSLTAEEAVEESPAGGAGEAKED